MITTYFNPVGVMITVSVIIALLMPVRDFLHKKYSARLSRIMWRVLAIRLLVPFGISYSQKAQPAVQITVANPVVWQYAQQNNAQAEENIAVIPEQPQEQAAMENITDNQSNAVISQNTIIQQENSVSAEDTTPAAQSDTHFALHLSDMFFGIWAAVARIMLIMSVVKYITLTRKIRLLSIDDVSLSNTAQRISRSMGLQRKFCIVYSQLVDVPFLCGLLHPMVVIPHQQYTDTELEMIIRHELTHLMREDILYKMLVYMAACAYWFNPLMWKMTKMADEDIEYACDEQTLSGKDHQFIADYAQCIISVINRQHSKQIFMTTAFGSERKSIMKRFSFIFSHNAKKQGGAVATLFVCLAVMAGSFVGCTSRAQQPETEPEQWAENRKPQYVYWADDSGRGNTRTLDFDDLLYESSTNKYPQFTGALPFQGMYKTVSNNVISVMYPDGSSEIRCRIPGCDHQNDNCVARLYHSSAEFFQREGQLYYLQKDSYSNAAIYKLDTENMTEKQLVYDLGNITSHDDCPIFVDTVYGDKVVLHTYVQTYILSLSDLQIHMVVNRDGIYYYPEYFDFYNGVILSVYHNFWQDDEGNYQQEHTLYALNLEDMSLEDFANVDMPAEAYLSMGKAYCIDDNTLYCIDLSNGQQNTITDDLKRVYTRAGDYHYSERRLSYYIRNMYDGNLLLFIEEMPSVDYAKENINYKRYSRFFIIDTTANTITYTDKAYTNPGTSIVKSLTPVAMLDGDIVVIRNNKMYYDTLGLTHWRSELGLISPEDFNSGNYSAVRPAATVTSAG